MKRIILTSIILLAGLFSVSAQPGGMNQNTRENMDPRAGAQTQQRVAQRPKVDAKAEMAAYQALRPTPDKWANPTGKYAVEMVVDASLPDHTIYRPAGLNCTEKLPVIVMSGPGTDFDGDSYRPFWTELASHGYLIIAVGLPLQGGYRAPMGFNKLESIVEGIEWAVAESNREGSDYYGKLDASKIALMGQSAGGILATSLMSDTRVKTIILWNSSMTMPFGVTPEVEAQAAKKAADAKVPIAIFVGDTDMARPNGLKTYNLLKDNSSVPAFYAVRVIPGDAHGGTFREVNGGGYSPVGIAWLDWHLKGDTEAAKMFTGKNPGILNDPAWIEYLKVNIK